VLVLFLPYLFSSAGLPVNFTAAVFSAFPSLLPDNAVAVFYASYIYNP
jgi:hypothetical protein